MDGDSDDDVVVGDDDDDDDDDGGDGVVILDDDDGDSSHRGDERFAGEYDDDDDDDESGRGATRRFRPGLASEVRSRISYLISYHIHRSFVSYPTRRLAGRTSTVRSEWFVRPRRARDGDGDATRCRRAVGRTG